MCPALAPMCPGAAASLRNPAPPHLSLSRQSTSPQPPIHPASAADGFSLEPGHSAREGTNVPGVSAEVSRRGRVFAATRHASSLASATNPPGLVAVVAEGGGVC